MTSSEVERDQKEMQATVVCIGVGHNAPLFSCAPFRATASSSSNPRVPIEEILSPFK